MKLKYLILLFGIVFLTGCSANYNVEIYNNKVNVNGSVVETNSSKWDESIFDTTYRQMIEWKTTGDEETQIADGIFKISNDKELGIGLKNQYSLLEDYSTSPGLSCYEYFNVIDNDQEIVISTSLNNQCFEIYSNLESIKVNLKTNHKVISDNADSKNGYTYSWDINKTNYNNKSIQIRFYKSKYVWNYNNMIFKRLLLIISIISGTLLLVFIVYNVTKKISNKKNKF